MPGRRRYLCPPEVWEPTGANPLTGAWLLTAYRRAGGHWPITALHRKALCATLRTADHRPPCPNPRPN